MALWVGREPDDSKESSKGAEAEVEVKESLLLLLLHLKEKTTETPTIFKSQTQSTNVPVTTRMPQTMHQRYGEF